MFRRFWLFITSLFLMVPLLSTGLLPAQKAAQPKAPGAADIVHDERAGCAIVKGQLLVTLHQGVKVEDLKPILARMGAQFEVVSRIEKMNHYTLATDHERLPELKQRLENHPYVASAAFNIVTFEQRVFNDPVFKKPKDMAEDKDNWNFYRINVPDAWDITTGGAVVGVIDTGARLDHEDLAGRTTRPFSYATKSEQMQEGMRRIKRGKNIADQEIRNHGTHVSITIAGRADNGVGTAGIAPNSLVMPLQALIYRQSFPKENAGTVTGTNADISNAIALAAERGVGVINMSLGGVNGDLLAKWRAAQSEAEKQDFGQKLLALAEDHAKGMAPFYDRANRAGAIIVVAAGNDNMPAEFGGYSFSRRAISVAATTRDDTRAIFSNYGDFTTVSAPGHEIWSGVAAGNKSYGYMSGTSMACPHVAGVVALMKTLDPELKQADVADILVKTGRTLETDVPIGPLINAKAALEETRRRKAMRIRLPEPPPLVPPPDMNPTLPGLPDDGIAILRLPNPWNNPNVRRILRLWLAFAIARPPAGTDPDVRWFFNMNGQAVNNRTVLTVQRPIWFQFNYRWLWENSRKLESTNMGTLYEFTAGTLRLGKFNPAPPRVPIKFRPQKTDPQPGAKVFPTDPRFDKTKWNGKNAKGENVTIEFDKKGVSITHDGKKKRYQARINTYAKPMTMDFFPDGGGDPIRCLLHMGPGGDLSLRTDFTKKRPTRIAPGDKQTFALHHGVASPPVANAARGFQPGDGTLVDPRFIGALVSDGTTDCAGDCGKYAGNNASAGPGTGIAVKKLSTGFPPVGYHWVVRKFTDASGPRQYIAKMAKDPRYRTKTFDTGKAGFIVKSRSIGADHVKDTTEAYATVGRPYQMSSHTHAFVYRGTFLVTLTRFEARRGYNFSAESKRIEQGTKKLIDDRFPAE